MIPGRIRNKRQFYALWNAGLLGNRPRTWSSVEALEGARYGGTVTARSAAGAGGGQCKYGVRTGDAADVTRGWPAPTFNESAPDDRLLIQGEASREVGGLCLTYSTAPGLRMREAMKAAKTARGVTALVILGALLWPASRDDLEALWDLYPGAVIEFGAYECAVGHQSNRNTLIWEVRHY